MFKPLLTAGLLFGITGVATPAFAASCAQRDIVVQRLKAMYSEELTAGGIQSTTTTQNYVEVWSSRDTGTFTVILTTPYGLSCVVASGTDWQNVDLKPDLEGTPS